MLEISAGMTVDSIKTERPRRHVVYEVMLERTIICLSSRYRSGEASQLSGPIMWRFQVRLSHEPTFSSPPCVRCLSSHFLPTHHVNDLHLVALSHLLTYRRSSVVMHALVRGKVLVPLNDHDAIPPPPASPTQRSDGSGVYEDA
jgi:hypothetical protein